MTDTPSSPINLSVKVEGMVLSNWIGLSLICTVIIAAVVLLLGVFVLRDVEREIRILQVHTQDVENVLIRRGVATRQDFIEWEPGTPKATQPSTIQITPHK